MKIIEPFVGEHVDEVCRKIYFMMLESDEPILTHFNEVSILFTKDDGGFHYRSSDIDHVKLERVRGMSNQDLVKKSEEFWKNRPLDSTATSKPS
jgi:hypothetical protein